jgi:hypothetical protein
MRYPAIHWLTTVTMVMVASLLATVSVKGDVYQNGQPSSGGSSVANGITSTDTNNWSDAARWVGNHSNDLPVYSNNMASTTAGQEGIRNVGALGGYTLEEFIEDTATRGPSRDLPQFSYQPYPATNLVISWAEGDVYDPVNGYFHLSPGTHTLVNNAVNIAYWATNNPTIINWTTGARPDASQYIYLGTFVTAFGSIIHSGPTIGVGDELLYEDQAFANIMPSIITEGLTAFASDTNRNSVVMNGGVEYHNMADRIVHPTVSLATSSNLVMYGHSGTSWTTTSTNLFPLGLWDNGSNTVACDTSKWYRGVFVSLGIRKTSLDIARLRVHQRDSSHRRQRS